MLIETHYRPFIRQPLQKFEGYDFYPYISPEDIEQKLRAFASKINPGDYDVLMPVMNAGLWFLNKLQLFVPAFAEKEVVPIEYHGSPYSSKPQRAIAIPEKYRSSSRNLAIEGVIDTVGTLSLIYEDCPNMNTIAICKKIVPDAGPLPPRVSFAFLIDNVWMFGTGPDAGKTKEGHPPEYGRNYPGIGVIPSSVE